MFFLLNLRKYDNFSFFKLISVIFFNIPFIYLTMARVLLE